MGLKPKRTSTALNGKVQSMREMVSAWPGAVTGGSSEVKSISVFTAWALPSGRQEIQAVDGKLAIGW